MSTAPPICPAQHPSDPAELRVETPPAPPLAEVLARWRREATFGVCDTGRYRCRYYTWGEGPPIVFIHGLADAPDGFAPMIARLSSAFRCIAYALPCGGADRASLGRYRPHHLVADLFALLDHLCLPRAYAFGSSFGSTVTLRALAERPDRLPRAVLQGAFAWRPLSRAQRFLCQAARYWRGRMSDLPFRLKVLARTEGHGFAQAAPGAWEFLLANSGSTPIPAAARVGLMIDQLDLRPLLSRVGQPVLLIGGDTDRVVPPRFERMLLDGLPNVDRAELPGCGHLPQYTHPELTAELVRRFLTPPGCEGAGC
jgi:pimeloyl-ACP methyl ester carboxylesterase